MREITLHELHRLALLSRRALWDAAELAGHDTPKIYLHWTAGGYWHFFDDYQINIDEDGGLHASTEDLAEVLAHTWRRNTGGCGNLRLLRRDDGEFRKRAADVGTDRRNSANGCGFVRGVRAARRKNVCADARRGGGHRGWGHGGVWI